LTRALDLPAFRRLLSAYTLNELAWGIGTVALALVVYRRTGTALGAAGFFLCASFAPALFSPALVARLDQRPVRHVLPALYVLEMVAFLVFAWLVGRFSLVAILLLALADGTVGLSARALARAASVSVLTPAGLLREGNALANAAFAICFMAGPAVGGALVATGGTRTALLVNSGLFATMAVTLGSARGLPAAPAERAPIGGRLRAALRHAAASVPIRRLLWFQGVALVFFTISIPVEVVYAQHSLHTGPGGYGALLSAWGAGAIVGSAIYARARRSSARVLIAGGAAAVGAGFVTMAAAPSLVLAIVGAALGGAGNGIEVVSMRTALQERVGAAWMARMMSVNESLGQAVPGIGIALGGALAALASPRTALAVAGVGALVIAGLAAAVLEDGGTPGEGGEARLLPDASAPASDNSALWMDIAAQAFDRPVPDGGTVVAGPVTMVAGGPLGLMPDGAVPAVGRGQAASARQGPTETSSTLHPAVAGTSNGRAETPVVLWGLALALVAYSSRRLRRRAARR
jgi:MFS family permease